MPLPRHPFIRIIPHMKELLIYSISACASLFILGYVVHIFIGGLVEPLTEAIAIGAAISTSASVMAWMVRDVLKSRQKHHK